MKERDSENFLNKVFVVSPVGGKQESGAGGREKPDGRRGRQSGRKGMRGKE